VKVLLLIPLLLLLFQAEAPEGPKQPIAFSHAQHAGELKMACKTCHTNPAPHEMMTFPKEETCMSCHAKVKQDSPEIQRLAEFVESKKRVPWVRVYQVPGFVFWSHETHLADNTCQDCHGEVSTMQVMHKAKETNMASCMACHAKKQVSNACNFCHELR
jgi:hypothetical protein